MSCSFAAVSTSWESRATTNAYPLGELRDALGYHNGDRATPATHTASHRAALLRAVSCSLVPQLVSRLMLPSPDTGSTSSGTSTYPPPATSAGGGTTCFALCPGPTTKPIGSDRSSLPRVVVGYSDGSIACAAMPPPVSSSGRLRDVGGFDDVSGARGVVPVRRLRRVSAGGSGGGDGGGAAVEAAITTLCSLSAPLIVAGDSDGRLGLWTVSSTRSASARYAPEYPKLFLMPFFSVLFSVHGFKVNGGEILHKLVEICDTTSFGPSKSMHNSSTVARAKG